MSAGDRPDASRSRRLQRNLPLLSAYRGLQMTMFPIAIVPLYWRDELDLGMSEIFLVQAIFGLFAACLEFPGGYLADRIGYRPALLLATLCSALGWVTLGLADSMAVLLLGELMLAMSLSLTSGTDAAILYESLLELDREPEFGRWFGRTRAIGAASEGTAALLAGLLFSIWPPLPFFLQALVWGVNALIAWQIIEPARQPLREGHDLARMRAIFRYAMIGSPRLRASMGLVLASGWPPSYRSGSSRSTRRTPASRRPGSALSGRPPTTRWRSASGPAIGWPAPSGPAAPCFSVRACSPRASAASAGATGSSASPSTT
jgi:MFS family permease